MSRPLDYREALALVRTAFADRAAPVESLPLAHARDRVLARELRAPRAVPGFANAAMDGYAVRAADLAPDAPTRLALAPPLMAGAEPSAALAPGHAARIMTGAALPPGADTVVVLEHALGESADSVALKPGTAPGANVRAADDDLAAGALALAAGTRLGPAALGVAASLGLATLEVRRRPRVAILITGDELLAAGETWRYGRRYDSNGAMLVALAEEAGLEPVRAERVPDQREWLRARLSAAAADADLVLSSGGASGGDLDLVPDAVKSLGEIVFWRVAIKPGMPTLFGRIGATPMFGLPGNPASVHAMFHAFVRPALAAWLACPALDPAPLPARLAHAFAKTHGRYELRRGQLAAAPDGGLVCRAHGQTSSGALASVAQSNALLLLEPGARDYAAGTILPVRPIEGGIA